MSHFTVLVVTDTQPTQDILHATLLPFHEYECTGYEEYLEFVSFEDVEATYKEHGEGEPLEEFVKEWFSSSAELRNGVWGKMTNPNKKWDWWVVGGRWSNMLALKSGGKGSVAQKSDLDLARMAYDRGIMRTEQWEGYAKDIREGKSHESAAYWNGIPQHITDRETFLAIDPGFTTFAVLWKGEWYEKGRMGWWAMVSDEKQDWLNIYQRIFVDIPDDAWLTVVDCHI